MTKTYTSLTVLNMKLVFRCVQFLYFYFREYESFFVSYVVFLSKRTRIDEPRHHCNYISTNSAGTLGPKSTSIYFNGKLPLICDVLNTVETKETIERTSQSVILE